MLHRLSSSSRMAHAYIPLQEGRREMILLILTFLVVISLEQRSASFCNLTQEKDDLLCYGALGESSSFLVANQNNKQIILKKGDKPIIKTGEGCRLKFSQDYVNRSEFLNNTTFRLDSLTYNDIGDYQLEIYNSNGTFLRTVKMHLQLQAPVSETMLSHLCLSHGETMVTCSSEGDSLQFSWTLNNQKQTRTVASDQYHSSVISLKADVTGALTCMVQNEVSSSTSTMTLPACPVFASQFYFLTVTVGVASTLGTLLLLINISIGIKHLCGKSGKTTSGLHAEIVSRDHREARQNAPATETTEYGQIKTDASPILELNSESLGYKENFNLTYETSLITSFGWPK